MSCNYDVQIKRGSNLGNKSYDNEDDSKKSSIKDFYNIIHAKS